MAIKFYPATWNNFHSGDSDYNPEQGAVVNCKGNSTEVEQTIDTDAKTISIRVLPGPNVSKWGWPWICSSLVDVKKYFPGYSVKVNRESAPNSVTNPSNITPYPAGHVTSTVKPMATTPTTNIAGAPTYINQFADLLNSKLDNLGVNITGAGQAANAAANSAQSTQAAVAAATQGDNPIKGYLGWAAVVVLIVIFRKKLF